MLLRKNPKIIKCNSFFPVFLDFTLEKTVKKGMPCLDSGDQMILGWKRKKVEDDKCQKWR